MGECLFFEVAVKGTWLCGDGVALYLANVVHVFLHVEHYAGGERSATHTCSAGASGER